MKLINHPTMEIVPVKIVHDKRNFIQKILASPKETDLEITYLNGIVKFTDIEIESSDLVLYEKVDLIIDEYKLYGVLPMANYGNIFSCKLDYYEMTK